MRPMIDTDLILNRMSDKLARTNTLQMRGRVTKVVGSVLESEGPKAPIGEVCSLLGRDGEVVCRSEIVGFRDGIILSMPLGELTDISPGMEIVAMGEGLSVRTSPDMLGRILDGLGHPMDGGEPIKGELRSVYSMPPNPLTRTRISQPLQTGIRALDGLLTIGKGQRMGIFAGSGVGKSTLIGMIARNTSADVNVIALIGERGREVKEFIEKDLGPDGLKRSVLIIATSESPPLVRVKAALTATAIAEYFRDQSLDVLLMMDSITRFSMAQREVGLSIGEPPTSKGYTPSVFQMMQKTMERAGTSSVGSITGLYTVLVEGDDFNEPVSDAARGILDGHTILTRRLASFGHYPAIDVLESVSRVMGDVIPREQMKAARSVKEMMATYRGAEDLISVGAYQKGTNAAIDRAVANIDRINGFLRQGIEEETDFESTSGMVLELGQSA